MMILRLTPIVLLVACAPKPEPEPLPVEPPASAFNEQLPDTCKLTDFEALVGQPFGALEALGLPEVHRFITPGSIVSEEYNAARVNIHIGPDGTVTKLACG